MNRAELLACPECDLLQSDSAVPRPRKALCARCGATLYQRHDNGLERTAALSLAALVVFALGNGFPIFSLELQGERTSATLVGAVAALSPAVVSPRHTSCTLEASFRAGASERTADGLHSVTTSMPPARIRLAALATGSVRYATGAETSAPI